MNDIHEIEVVPPFVADHNVAEVYPVGDLRPHDLNRGKCWCRPSVECTGEGGWVVVHNSIRQTLNRSMVEA